MKCAEIYLRKGNFYITSKSKTTTGLFIFAGPITVEKDSLSDEALGKNILDTLVFSTENIPNPIDWSQYLKPFLALAKVKSWKTFMSDTELISLENINGTIELVPCVNQGVTGPNRGFTPNEDKTLVLSENISIAELGKAIKKMFQNIKLDEHKQQRPKLNVTSWKGEVN
jgi:hypothetical protein